MHTTQERAIGLVHLERQLELLEDVLEATRLEAARAGLGVAVHRVADPQHLLTRFADGFDHRRQAFLHILRAEAVNDGETPWRVLRIERGDETLQPFGRHGRPDLHAHGVGDAPEKFHVRAVEGGSAHADPRHVSAEVVPALLTFDVTRLRLLVMHQQAFVRGEEIDGGDFMRRAAAAHPLEEVERVADRIDDLLVLLDQRRMLHEAEVPVPRVMQVGEAAVTQRTYKIERERGAFVAAQQQRGVRLTCFRGELGAIHQIATERGQRDAVARLGIRRSGFGVLARHAADANDGFLETVQQHEAHLQEDLELLCDLVRLAFLKGLGAVAAHEQEFATDLRLGETLAQLLDLPRHDERWQGPDRR